MPLCNLLVHLDSGERSAARLKLAADIARSRGARLTGLFAQVAPAHRVGVVTDWPTADYTRAADASRAAFLAATGASTPNGMTSIGATRARCCSWRPISPGIST